ncbi:ribosomal RNA-processing protein 8 [Anopheles maculipalpis]|uniref:ribosomal RNA-processing protein 8 n=1 Tax=Anopheles maculipalpis TaxID=1496333 RepID=UPI00215943E0|nr:ribosomal RNA-processing protein 8 [Anopheles maculipalpis]
MSKLFSECEWEDDLPTIGTNFRFSKKREDKKPKKKKTDLAEAHHVENGNHQQENGIQKPNGWSVLLKNGKNNSKHVNDDADNPSNAKNSKPKSDKRKADDTVDVVGNKTATKKIKSNETIKVTEAAKQNGKVTSKGSNPNTNSTGSHEEKKKPKSFKKPGEGCSNLRDKLVDRLKGSRFRFINEQLYKIPGKEAKKLFQEDPASFDAYHEGYRQQVEQWPMNPLNRMIKCILKLPKDTIVADFGCGEAKLAASVPHKVYSLDLMSNNSSVIACDMANTPLESNFVNVVIFCLSLMGTNLADFFLEANRVLKVGGIMKIAEVSSRFDNVNVFVSNVQRCGFKLENKDLKHSLFYFFNFKKERTVLKGSTNTKQFSLKPCLYKKR